MRGRLAQLRNIGWGQAVLLALAGSFGCFVLAALLLSLLSPRSMPLNMAWIAATLPALVAAPLFFLLGLTRHELASVKDRYAQAVAQDSLTSCLNSAVFSAMVDAHPTLVGSRGERRKGALLVIDVDFLGRLNEAGGHRSGDQALRAIAGIIRASVRSGDLVGRIGGQEFGVFLPGATRENAEQVAERVRREVSEARFETGGSKWPLSVSVGAVVFEDEIDFDELVRTADRKLRTAKNNGRNRVEYAQLGPGTSRTGPMLH